MAKQTSSAQAPMSDADGLRLMQRTEEARGCHHLAAALQAGAEALDTLAHIRQQLEASEPRPSGGQQVGPRAEAWSMTPSTRKALRRLLAVYLESA